MLLVKAQVMEIGGVQLFVMLIVRSLVKHFICEQNGRGSSGVMFSLPYWPATRRIL